MYRIVQSHQEISCRDEQPPPRNTTKTSQSGTVKSHPIRVERKTLSGEPCYQTACGFTTVTTLTSGLLPDFGVQHVALDMLLGDGQQRIILQQIVSAEGAYSEELQDEVHSEGGGHLHITGDLLEGARGPREPQTPHETLSHTVDGLRCT